VILLAALTVLVYANSLLNGFTIEDRFTFSDDYFTKHLRNLPLLFDSGYFQRSNEDSYRPVCTLTYFLDTAMWGDWKMGPHLTNLAIYVLTVMVVFAFYLRLTGNEWAGFFGAALFAVYPIHTEVMNNIAYRGDLLIGLFVPASWLIYKRAERGKVWLWMPLAWVAYLLAVFSNEVAVMFLLLLVLIDWFECDEPLNVLLTRRRLLFLAGIVVCTIFFVLVCFHWMRIPGEEQGHLIGGSLARTLVADVKILGKYMLLFVFPYPLCALYPPSAYSPNVDNNLFVSLGGLIVMISFLVYFRRERFFVLGLLWWIVCLLPVSNLKPIINPMAERYLFLPSIGICLWLGWAAAKALEVRARPIAITVMAVAVAVLSSVTFLRNMEWRNNVTLWRITSEEVPGDMRVLANLAFAYYEQGEYVQAIHEADNALLLMKKQSTETDQAAVYLCLGCSYYKINEPYQALSYLKKAQVLLPVRSDIDAAVYRNIGMIYDDRNDPRVATKYYERSVSVDPFRTELWRRLTYCELRLGKTDLAQRKWQKVRDLDPLAPTFEKIQELFKKSPRAATLEAFSAE